MGLVFAEPERKITFSPILVSQVIVRRLKKAGIARKHALAETQSRIDPTFAQRTAPGCIGAPWACQREHAREELPSDVLGCHENGL